VNENKSCALCTLAAKLAMALFWITHNNTVLSGSLNWFLLIAVPSEAVLAGISLIALCLRVDISAERCYEHFGEIDILCALLMSGCCCAICIRQALFSIRRRAYRTDFPLVAYPAVLTAHAPAATGGGVEVGGRWSLDSLSSGVRACSPDAAVDFFVI